MKKYYIQIINTDPLIQQLQNSIIKMAKSTIKKSIKVPVKKVGQK